MAGLHRLALQYQQALDSDRGTAPGGAVEAAGGALVCAVHQAMFSPEGFAKDPSVLEPIILRTTLAASLVEAVERIPWAAATPQMLSDTRGTPLAVADNGGWLLLHLCSAAEKAEGSQTVPALLLRQVCFRSADQGTDMYAQIRNLLHASVPRCMRQTTHGTLPSVHVNVQRKC